MLAYSLFMFVCLPYSLIYCISDVVIMMKDRSCSHSAVCLIFTSIILKKRVSVLVMNMTGIFHCY